MSIQNIKRPPIRPTFWANVEQTAKQLQGLYGEIAQQTVLMQNSFWAGAFPVVMAAATIVVPSAPATLTDILGDAVVFPGYPDTSYGAYATLDWNAYGYITAISPTSFTITFSAAAPAAQVVRLFTVR